MIVKCFQNVYVPSQFASDSHFRMVCDLVLVTWESSELPLTFTDLGFSAKTKCFSALWNTPKIMTDTFFLKMFCEYGPWLSKTLLWFKCLLLYLIISYNGFQLYNSRSLFADSIKIKWKRIKPKFSYKQYLFPCHFKISLWNESLMVNNCKINGQAILKWSDVSS